MKHSNHMPVPGLIGLRVYFLLFSSICLITFMQVGCDLSSGGTGIFVDENKDGVTFWKVARS